MTTVELLKEAIEAFKEADACDEPDLFASRLYPYITALEAHLPIAEAEARVVEKAVRWLGLHSLSPENMEKLDRIIEAEHELDEVTQALIEYEQKEGE